MSDPNGIRPDWQDAEAYAWATALPQTGFAWEFLRRDRDYQTAWHARIRTTSSAGSWVSHDLLARSPDPPDPGAWGLVRFRGSAPQCAVLRSFLASRSLPRSPSLIRRCAQRRENSRRRYRSFHLQYRHLSRRTGTAACALLWRRTLSAIGNQSLNRTTYCLDDGSHSPGARDHIPPSGGQAPQRSLHPPPTSSPPLSTSPSSDPPGPGPTRPRCVA